MKTKVEAEYHLYAWLIALRWGWESEKAGLKLNIQKAMIMASSPSTWQIDGNRLLFWGVPKSLWMVTTAMKLKDGCSLEEKLQPTQTVY